VYDDVLSCLESLKNFEGKDFRILSIEIWAPAIKFEVTYISNACLDEPESKLHIDYVPAVCFNKQTFVAKPSVPNANKLHWRETFSKHEVVLMKEIRSLAPPLVELYQCFKVLHTAALDIRYISHAIHCKEEVESGLRKWKKLLTLDTSASKQTKLCIESLKKVGLYQSHSMFYHLEGYGLKMSLFQFWTRAKRDMFSADNTTCHSSSIEYEELAAAYVRFIVDCYEKGHVRNYSNILERVIFRNSRPALDVSKYLKYDYLKCS